MLEQEKKQIGKRIIDIGELVDVFEAQEGEVHHIIGKTGMGKTTEATRRAYEYLRNGYVVYTTWKLNLPDEYDERESFKMTFFNMIGFQKHFFSFDFKKNWKYLDIDRPDLVEYVSSLTDCIVMLDEEQDIFNSNERISKANRKVLTRTRHLRKTLIIISQRAQAVDVNARANVTYYYKCVKGTYFFFPFKPYHRIFRTEELDSNNLPIWEDRLTDFRAELWKAYFPSNNLYNMFNSWYLRAGVPKSQEINFKAYELNFKQRFQAFFSSIKRIFKKKENIIDRKIKELEETGFKAEHMANNKAILDKQNITKTKKLSEILPGKLKVKVL